MNSTSDEIPEEDTPGETGKIVEDFPTARIETRPSFMSQLATGSRMWWLTLASLALAVGLVWYSLPEWGSEILIRFPDGHGLKVEDQLRYRGIDVGVVSSVELSSDLSDVIVKVTLNPDGEILAREESRFWIVRPELSLTRIRGLDTAVGAKYIEVSPGAPTAKKKFSFEGLAEAPVDEIGSGHGVEIILRSEQRKSVAPGSPIAWRGVEVGKILSVDLSHDSRHVLTHARIHEKYARLLRTNSNFWVTSGVGIDFGLLKGLKLNAESLETMARGGVSFITNNDDQSEPVSPGHIFTLHAEPDPDWLDQKNSVQLIDFELPATTAIHLSWKLKRLSFMRERKRVVTGFVVADRNNPSRLRLIAPREAAIVADGGTQDSLVVQIPSRDGKDMLAIDIDDFKEISSGMVSIPLGELSGPIVLPPNSFRAMTQPEDCCAVRTVTSNSTPAPVIFTMIQSELKQQDAHWQLRTSPRGIEAWHGSPVVSMRDGKIFGIMLVADGKATIVPWAGI